ncbi:BZ3500_MvSof-1268-A1-R1_Chr2-1g04255 [Microbotryum saponariae]|uniref:BZ3500_MvSof-1268-A1-R1_Chr2-1g04255 protein n=1 Tax=Microbotryum saponariae TaxID=289078 RepID=A0A2X0KD36_9BASI|nr:BZ3500_MvSof-1268-A1-R1_Chr2-1g04255 [Microbotryum saponariae]SCZ91242.1 BZ3501_MvSof-1269-A2-R1_Chr2-1g03911 [Microbotryum saponariae]
MSTAPRMAPMDGYVKVGSGRKPLRTSLSSTSGMCNSSFFFSRLCRDRDLLDLPKDRSKMLARLTNRLPSQLGGSSTKLASSSGSRPGFRNPAHVPSKKRPTYQLSEFNCNPFEELGRLIVNVEDVTANVWAPYDRSCAPSNYMKDLYRSADDNVPFTPRTASAIEEIGDGPGASRRWLPLLVDRTVLIHGDSIDRFHLKDFCELVKGELTLIDPKHPESPPPHRSSEHLSPGVSEEERNRRKEKEATWEKRPTEGHVLTNPWVCNVQEYNFTLINVFTWGLEGAEEFFETERWYHPPGEMFLNCCFVTTTWTERLEAITLPLLNNLARHFNRPQIRYPDLVELNSGYWDLRKYTEEDFVAAGWKTRPYPEDSPIPYQNLQPGREVIWEREARKAIRFAARAFKGPDGTPANGPAILWRTLHHPPRHKYAPYNRVFALDNLARKVVLDLQNGVTTPMAAHHGSHDVDLNLGERLRLDESGRLMLGQEQLFRDLLHPLAIPGSYFWGNIMLYELKRVVKGIGRDWSAELERWQG